MGRVTKEMVERWQHAGHVHELTCGNDSTHPALEYAGDLSYGIVLKCPNCDYRQVVPDSSPLAEMLVTGPGISPYDRLLGEAGHPFP